jgi:glycerol-3-phosphate dehydrogenase
LKPEGLSSTTFGLQTIASTNYKICPSMQRTLPKLSKKTYDVAVVGGGIYGAYVALDATLRGLRVALIEQGDFGHATSANSQRIIHGGLRYLQHGDLVRMRDSIRERRVLLRTAPHLVDPMPVVVPTYGSGLQSRWTLGAALALNDLISADRNRGLPPDKHIPNGRLISRTECLRLCPYLAHLPLSGGALFFDGQVRNSERHVLAVIQAASQAGADVVNYVRATGLTTHKGRVCGLEAEDRQTGASFGIAAQVVVNCAGPWIDSVLAGTEGALRPTAQRFFKAILFVTRALSAQVAVGVPSATGYHDQDAWVQKGNRLFFITPWHGRSLVGTFYAKHHGTPDAGCVTEAEMHSALQQLNAALPGAQLAAGDIYGGYAGLLPQGGSSNNEDDDFQYAKQHRIYDHATADGVTGLISVLGVKYTTARAVAEQTVDLAMKRLGRRAVPGQTGSTPVYGGAMHSLAASSVAEQQRQAGRLSVEMVTHLIRTYGSAYPAVLCHAGHESRWLTPIVDHLPVTGAEVLHAVRDEMARRLTDVVLRRTEAAFAGHPGLAFVERCADIMGQELGWEAARRFQEIDQTIAELSKRGLYDRESIQIKEDLDDRAHAVLCG